MRSAYFAALQLVRAIEAGESIQETASGFNVSVAAAPLVAHGASRRRGRALEPVLLIRSAAPGSRSPRPKRISSIGASAVRLLDEHMSPASDHWMLATLVAC
jgi:hypothetical protein